MVTRNKTDVNIYMLIKKIINSMFFKIYTKLFIFVLCSFTANAEERNFVSPDQVEVFALLKDGQPSGFLFGSHHMVLANDLFPIEIQEKMASISHFITEISSDDTSTEDETFTNSLASLLDDPELKNKLPEDLRHCNIEYIKNSFLNLLLPNWKHMFCKNIIYYFYNWFVQNICATQKVDDVSPDVFFMSLGKREGAHLYPLEDNATRKESGFFDDESDNEEDEITPVGFKELDFDKHPLNALVFMLDIVIAMNNKTFRTDFLKNSNNGKAEILPNGNVRVYDFRPFFMSCLINEDDLFRLKPEKSCWDHTKTKVVEYCPAESKSFVYRQRHWQKTLPQMISCIGGEPFVVCVGRTHLNLRVANPQGEQEDIGVIHMLERLGYQARPIKPCDIPRFFPSKLQTIEETFCVAQKDQ